MDYLVRGTARNDRVRIIGCECSDTINLICKKHECYPIATIVSVFIIVLSIAILVIKNLSKRKC